MPRPRRSGSIAPAVFFLNKYTQTVDEAIETSRALRWKATISGIAFGTLAAAGIGAAYIYIIYLALTNTIGIGDVVMYSSSVFYAGGSIRALIGSAGMLSTNILSVEKFFPIWISSLQFRLKKALTALTTEVTSG